MNKFIPKIIDYILSGWSNKKSVLVEKYPPKFSVERPDEKVTHTPEEVDIIGCKTCKYQEDYLKQVRGAWLLGSRCHWCSGGNHMIPKIKYEYWEELVNEV